MNWLDTEGSQILGILALDGGGIKGTLRASVLATLEEATRKSTARHGKQTKRHC